MKSEMKSQELQAWQSRMGWSGLEASKRLGVSYASYRDWVAGVSRTSGKPIKLPPLLPLACRWLESQKNQ